ncbi:phosphate ABC transporter substrate-binding protein PstS [Georgenia sp. SYP-B2076]|uniref:phosphate ABC transporter substrate-binding protein PstS n=1 Tax=Georgenia sp. SYP-B2076 TaxID=2495881 RepID=UPI000F8E8E5E|nr:phosphate ABC transporter substrate-binding protein PstS [Georgenia sp. SYP-B2076]
MTVKLAGSRRLAGVATISALAITLAACSSSSDDGASAAGSSAGGETAAALSGTLPGAGATSQEKAMNGWMAGFTEANPDVQVSYDPTGSGTGREMFLNGSALFVGSDAALKPEEVTAAKERCFGGEALELPLYISPIAVSYNLPGLDAEHINLDPATLAKIFAGEIKTWNDPAIAATNEGVELPDTAIIPINRSDSSGTTENFTEYLDAASGGAWTHGAVEDWPVQGTQSGNGTSGVVSTLEGAEGGIAYLDASQVPDGFGTVAVKVGEEFVPFSAEAAAAVVDASPATEDATDLRLTIDLARDTQESGTYPIVLVSYSIACSTYDSDQDAANVKALLSYIASPEGQERAADPSVAGSAPISDTLRGQVDAAIEKISAA